MRHLIVAFLILVLGMGCVTLPMKYDPPAEKPLTRSIQIQAAPESVWSAAIRYFSQNNVPIENMDHSSFFIKTQPVELSTSFTKPGVQVDLKNEFCNCGKAILEDLYTQYNRVTVSFNIVLAAKSANDTEASTNVFFEGRILGRRDSAAVGYDFELPLKCVSTGVLEDRLQKYLIEQSTAK